MKKVIIKMVVHKFPVERGGKKGAGKSPPFSAFRKQFCNTTRETKLTKRHFVAAECPNGLREEKGKEKSVAAAYK